MLFRSTAAVFEAALFAHIGGATRVALMVARIGGANRIASMAARPPLEVPRPVAPRPLPRARP